MKPHGSWVYDKVLPSQGHVLKRGAIIHVLASTSAAFFGGLPGWPPLPLVSLAAVGLLVHATSSSFARDLLQPMTRKTSAKTSRTVEGPSSGSSALALEAMIASTTCAKVTPRLPSSWASSPSSCSALSLLAVSLKKFLRVSGVVPSPVSVAEQNRIGSRSSLPDWAVVMVVARCAPLEPIKRGCRQLSVAAAATAAGSQSRRSRTEQAAEGQTEPWMA